MFSHRHRHWNHYRQGFTLIEVVAVIAIIVILLVAGVGLMGGSGAQARRSAADMLTGMIEQARTTAITTRSHVMLAVAEPGDLTNPDQRCRIGLIKVKVWPDNPGTSVIENTPDNEVVLLGRWKTLENGVIIWGGNPPNHAGVVNPMDKDELSLKLRANQPSFRVHAIVFDSRGGLVYPVQRAQVLMRVAEGGYRDGRAQANKRGEGIPENLLKVGGVTGRPYRIDG